MVRCKNADCLSLDLDYLKLQIKLQQTRRDAMSSAAGFSPFSGLSLLSQPVRESSDMTEHSLWRFSRALHRAINDRQFDDLAAALDDDVDWAIYGPIDMFPFLGARRGRDAVVEVVKQIAENVRVHRFDRETIMLGVDSAASMMRYSLTSLESNKPISLRVAHFAQFKGGRLSNIRVLMDSFDLVEQALGQSIHLPRMTA
jgi:ketosteroid isomerase-like protein